MTLDNLEQALQPTLYWPHPKEKTNRLVVYLCTSGVALYMGAQLLDNYHNGIDRIAPQKSFKHENRRSADDVTNVASRAQALYDLCDVIAERDGWLLKGLLYASETPYAQGLRQGEHRGIIPLIPADAGLRATDLADEEACLRAAHSHITYLRQHHSLDNAIIIFWHGNLEPVRIAEIGPGQAHSDRAQVYLRGPNWKDAERERQLQYWQGAANPRNSEYLTQFLLWRSEQPISDKISTDWQAYLLPPLRIQLDRSLHFRPSDGSVDKTAQ